MDIVVETSLGKLRGATNTDTGIHRFRGVHYGAATGGASRFRPASPAAPWTGVRDALEFGPLCPQRGSLVEDALADNRVIGPLPPLPQSEDCLVLNLWTPGVNDGRKRPVMLWLHGRGYAYGAGSEGWYDGERLSRRGDVVVITINHRLNVFGYLHLADLGGEKYAGSGVAGLLDAVLALQWVRDNAAAFGGDPNNVTIFGESGGGSKVSTLLAMPAAKGLFHKAIIQSGPGLRGVERPEANELSERVLAELALDAKRVDELQAVDAQALLLAIEKINSPARGAGPLPMRGAGAMMRFSPVVDGTYLPRHPFDPDAPPTAAGVPLLIGSNLHEVALFFAADKRRRKLEDSELQQRVTMMLGAKTDHVIAAYKKSRPEATPWDLWVAISSEPFHRATIRLAERKAAADAAPVYMYLFTWESDFMGGLFKSAHALEIPFVFDNTEVVPLTGSRPDKTRLVDAVSEAWIAFARRGDPSHAGLPAWKPYSAEQRNTMILDVPCRAEVDPRREELDAWRTRR
jgi:para-nitrobenzyl esterase